MDLLLAKFPRPRYLLVQWVPHGFGFRSMNLPFCLWLLKRARRCGDIVDIMVHEPGLGFREGTWRQDAVAAVHRIMMCILSLAARRIWCATPAWESRWRPYTVGRNVVFEWVPIPANIPVSADREGVAIVRDQYKLPDQPLVGYFGPYNPPYAAMLTPILTELCQENHRVLLLGRGSDTFQKQWAAAATELAEKAFGTGDLDPEALSQHVAACDVMLHVYPDGVSTRRTTMMASLAHGKATVTGDGRLTEPFWRHSGATCLVRAGDLPAYAREIRRLVADSPRRAALEAAASKLYRERFSLTHTIAALRRAKPAGT
jgi:hypothetical protein